MPTHPTSGLGDLAEQYKTDDNLRVRIETHEKYTVGPQLEPAIDAALSLIGDEDLLDVGAGPGDFSGRLRQGGHRGRLVGIDNSSGMVDRALASYPTVEFQRADAQQLPFPDKSFDVVTARHMLYHVPDISRALSEMHRVLRIGGRFLAATNAAGFMREYEDAIHQAVEAADIGLSKEMRQFIAAPIAAAFSEKNGTELIGNVFGEVQVQFVDSALVFNEFAPILRYFETRRSMFKEVPPESWTKVAGELESIVARKLEKGPWNIPKRVVLLSARA